MAGQSQPVRPTYRMRPQVSAWLTLLTFFFLFCMLVAGAGATGWFYYRNATQPLPPALVSVSAPSGVSIQQSDTSPLTIPQTVCPDSRKVCARLSEGMRVVANPEAGYGPVASLVLPDQSQIDLWAHPTGADLKLEQYHASRWTNSSQEIQLHQATGYARYDIRNGQRYANVHYTVTITNNVSVELAVPGSYSINVPNMADEATDVVTTTGTYIGPPPLVEVAVRSGSATIHSGMQQRTVEQNTKRQVTTAGVITEQMPPTWKLIADGQFEQYAEQHFYAPGQSKTWERFWSLGAPDLTIAERNGVFNVVQSCSPETPVLCENSQVNIGQFRRDGGQTRPFFVGIFQPLDVDVSEYKSLQLSAWVRVVYQSLPSVGDGTECPLLIHLEYKKTSPSDFAVQYICIYSSKDGNIVSQPEKHGDIYYKPVPFFEWYHLNVELRDIPALRDIRYLQTIRIEARGHDYVSEITDVGLVGRQ